MIDRGKLVILFVFLLSLAAAGFAWWYRVQQGSRALGFLGSESAMLVRDAPRVTLLLLSLEKPIDPDCEIVLIDSRPHFVVDRIQIEMVPGMLNARQALIEDASYDWDRPRREGDCQPNWEYILEFAKNSQVAALAVDFRCGRMRLVGRGDEVCMDPIADGLHRFIQEQINRLHEPDRSEATRG